MNSLKTKDSLISLARLIDLTSLNSTDTTKEIRLLCDKAKRMAEILGESGYPAAVCVFGPLVPVAVKALNGTPIQIAAVCGNFPSGMAPIKLKIEETRTLLDLGANEIDLVISIGRLIEGEYKYIAEEISSVKECCAAVALKVIIESGALGSGEMVKQASEIALSSGADFLKTSTGKVPVGATLEHVRVMLQCIKAHFEKTGRRVGIKPSGGISTISQAQQYIDLVNEVLGEDWLTPELCRFGASKLVDEIVSSIREI